ncbi:MAG: high-affinity branched-chain amino acid transport system permease protein LivH [Devosia sp.]|jgi:branched-chain amino acid transport system permease protein|nr:high-affinity branched-chain amino acid transport system permease protein LivH [Devosia sp.]RYE45826.1 MAG: branched-chain amino acid ABC transporter permease [Hyphomicrobiales bacterium]
MNELIFFFNNVVVAGVVLGSIYAVGAIGVTLIFGILRFAHFAHGDMMTMGAFIAFLLAMAATALGITTPVVPTGFLVLPLAMILAAIIALGLDKGFYAPLRKRGARPVTMLIASIGVTLIIQGMIRLFFGSGTYSFFETEQKQLVRIPVPLEGVTRTINFTQPQLLMVLCTAVAVLALHFFLTRSRLGKAMRAMADNADLAQVSGINTKLVVRVTWIIAGSLAAMAGTMLALDVNLKPDLAFNIVLPIFAAAIVGGLGQSYGAIAGGFLIGFAETLAIFNWSVLLRPVAGSLPFELPGTLAIVPTEYKLTVAFVILVVVLLWRPTGIFKGAST